MLARKALISRDDKLAFSGVSMVEPVQGPHELFQLSAPCAGRVEL
jgi:hypothetical protein